MRRKASRLRPAMPSAVHRRAVIQNKVVNASSMSSCVYDVTCPQSIDMGWGMFGSAAYLCYLMIAIRKSRCCPPLCKQSDCDIYAVPMCSYAIDQLIDT